MKLIAYNTMIGIMEMYNDEKMQLIHSTKHTLKYNDKHGVQVYIITNIQRVTKQNM